MNRTEDQLKDAMSFNERVAEAGAVAVVIGLVFEIVFAAAFHEPPETVWSRWGPVGSDVVVALGVAVEVLMGRRIKTLAAELTAISNKKVAEANERASVAEKAALDVSLELARYRFRRKPTAQQVAEIAAALIHFSGTHFDTAFVPNNLDAAELTGLIELSLQHAGWLQQAWSGNPGTMQSIRQGRPPSGHATLIGLHIIAPSQALFAAAQALAGALNDVGLEAKIVPNGGPPNHNDNAIHIVVGQKA